MFQMLVVFSAEMNWKLLIICCCVVLLVGGFGPMLLIGGEYLGCYRGQCLIFCSGGLGIDSTKRKWSSGRLFHWWCSGPYGGREMK